MADAQLFEETFLVSKRDKEKYDRVSRLSGSSDDGLLAFTLDINDEVWHVAPGQTIQIVLATTLALDGAAPERAETSWRTVTKGREPTLADMFEYVCYGKNYRFEDADTGTDTVKYYASFGGLLLYIEGPYRKLNGLKIDDIYMLCKVVQ
ncbi:DNA-directed RNA polymerases I, II, and III subunit RPABC3 [Pleosporales sp. CAS-2024a]